MNIFQHNPLADYLIEQGIEQGIKQGIKQGIEQERIALLQTLARKRFPHTREATLQLIETLHGESLQQLAEEILDIPDGRAFRRLLLQLKQQSESSAHSQKSPASPA